MITNPTETDPNFVIDDEDSVDHVSGTDNNRKTRLKTILITGCNSGIGFEAVRRICSRENSGNIVLILVCRTLEKSNKTVIALNEQVPGLKCHLVPEHCDLSSLGSIIMFGHRIKSLFEGSQVVSSIDVVAYNAGVVAKNNAKTEERTRDGFEMTVGTNHLGHFYLNSFLLPLINPDTGRIVVTTSSLHFRGSLGNFEGFKQYGSRFIMVNGGKFDPYKAFCDSKLCNLLFARELQRRLNNENSGIKVYSFSPGLCCGTSLFRQESRLFTTAFRIMSTSLLKFGETVSWCGGALEYMMLDSFDHSLEGGDHYAGPPGCSRFGDSSYGNQFTISKKLSKEALSEDVGIRLWDLSSKLVGLEEK